MTDKPLDGVVVVAVEQAVAVPFATRQLADLGARVIKIERRDGGDFARNYDHVVDGLSSAFLWLNRGKESVELDFKTAEGRVVLDALLERADVFLHNISPDAAKRQGLDSARLRVAFPSLICGSVSGYGSGPLAASKAYDLLVQGETGLISLSGTEEHPAKVGVSIADIAAGMYVYASTLAALRHRDLTGQALPVDISLFDSLTEWLGYPLLYTIHGGQPPKRMGTNHATIAPYGAFDTRDGQILLAIQNSAEWSRFCREVLSRPDVEYDKRFTSNALRVANVEELSQIINDVLRHYDRAAVVARLNDAGIANARLNQIQDLQYHEQLTQRDRWINVGSEVGPVGTLVPPWTPCEEIPTYGPVPALGQHTKQIYTWLGLTAPPAPGELVTEGEWSGT